jgi:sugar phosphate isomerase/epimerase
MDNDNDDTMTSLLAHSLEGNALGVKAAVDSMMSARAMDAIQRMKIDVAQSIYGNYAGDDAEDGSYELDPTESDEVEYDIPEDDDYLTDTDELFDELEDLTAEEEPTEQSGDEDV